MYSLKSVVVTMVTEIAMASEFTVVIKVVNSVIEDTEVKLVIAVKCGY
jgi:hypothetical protein